MKRRGFTLIELMVVVALIALPFGLIYLCALAVSTRRAGGVWPGQALLTQASVAILAATAAKDLLKWAFGRPWPVDEVVGNDIIFVTSTIGLAPLRPLIYEVLHRRADFGKVVICYGTRGTDDIMYEDWLHRWRARFDTNVHLTVHSAPSGYRGRVGGVVSAIKAARIDWQAAQAFVCRSEALTRQAVDALGALGVTTDRIWVTLERNMQCAVGLCGHCQLGPTFVCKDGPVYRFDQIEPLYSVREL